MIEKLGEFTEPLAMIGLFTLALVIFVLLANIFVAAKERIRLSLKKYRDKHKFKKPPTAKCYCIACQLWYAHDKERTGGRCGSWDGYHTSPEEFCSRGFPRDDDGYKDEEWRLKD
jgi:uncharacterized paraquat-inducible protein A